jgi:xylose isomerase
MGGFKKGGLNFDAKLRRASYLPEDIFYAHAAGMDAFAKGLKAAYQLLEDGVFDTFIKDRYESYFKGIGKEITDGRADFVSLEKYAVERETFDYPSGMQEYLETLLNEYIMSV